MSLDFCERSCWKSASCSFESLGTETTRTWLPVFLAQASAPDLQKSYSAPTDPQAIETVTPCARTPGPIHSEAAAAATAATRKMADMSVLPRAAPPGWQVSGRSVRKPGSRASGAGVVRAGAT